MPLLGAQTSIAGGYYRAVEAAARFGMETVQLFTKNNNQWRAKPLSDADIRQFRTALVDHGIQVPCAHDSYLINLASPKDELWDKSVDAFIVECNGRDPPDSAASSCIRAALSNQRNAGLTSDRHGSRPRVERTAGFGAEGRDLAGDDGRAGDEPRSPVRASRALIDRVQQPDATGRVRRHVSHLRRRICAGNAERNTGQPSRNSTTSSDSIACGPFISTTVRRSRGAASTGTSTSVRGISGWNRSASC